MLSVYRSWKVGTTNEITPCKDDVENNSFPAVHHVENTEKRNIRISLKFARQVQPNHKNHLVMLYCSYFSATHWKKSPFFVPFVSITTRLPEYTDQRASTKIVKVNLSHKHHARA
jgi:hypothetical protein